MDGITLIIDERVKQTQKLGKDVIYDVTNNSEYQLIDAVSALIIDPPLELRDTFIESQTSYPPVGWDREKWKKLLEHPYTKRLQIAGALIAAEIDRVNFKLTLADDGQNSGISQAGSPTQIPSGV